MRIIVLGATEKQTPLYESFDDDGAFVGDVRAGVSHDYAQDYWQCSMCTMINDIDQSVCTNSGEWGCTGRRP